MMNADEKKAYGKLLNENAALTGQLEEAEDSEDSDIQPAICEKVSRRMGLKRMAVSGLWLRRIGDHVEMLAEDPATGEFVLMAREHFDGPFSHIVEPLGISVQFRNNPNR